MTEMHLEKDFKHISQCFFGQAVISYVICHVSIHWQHFCTVKRAARPPKGNSALWGNKKSLGICV